MDDFFSPSTQLRYGAFPLLLLLLFFIICTEGCLGNAAACTLHRKCQSMPAKPQPLGKAPRHTYLGKKRSRAKRKKIHPHTHGVASYRKQLLSHSFAMATAAFRPPNGIGSDSSQTIQMIVSRTFAHSAFVPPGPVGPFPTQRPTDRSDVPHHHHQ